LLLLLTSASYILWWYFRQQFDCTVCRWLKDWSCMLTLWRRLWSSIISHPLLKNRENTVNSMWVVEYSSCWASIYYSTVNFDPLTSNDVIISVLAYSPISLVKFHLIHIKISCQQCLGHTDGWKHEQDKKTLPLDTLC